MEFWDQPRKMKVLAEWCRSISPYQKKSSSCTTKSEESLKELVDEIFTSTHEFLYLISTRTSQIGRSLFYTKSLLRGEVEGNRLQASGCSALL